jgi:hypothetical protein
LPEERDRVAEREAPGLGAKLWLERPPSRDLERDARDLVTRQRERLEQARVPLDRDQPTASRGSRGGAGGGGPAAMP